MMYLCMNQIRQNLTLSDPSCLNYLRFKPISLLLHISVAVCTLVRALNMSALFWYDHNNYVCLHNSLETDGIMENDLNSPPTDSPHASLSTHTHTHTLYLGMRPFTADQSHPSGHAQKGPIAAKKTNLKN